MQSRPLGFLDDCRPGVTNSDALSVQEKKHAFVKRGHGKHRKCVSHLKWRAGTQTQSITAVYLFGFKITRSSEFQKKLEMHIGI